MKSCSSCFSELGLFHLLWWCPVLAILLQMTAFRWIFMAEDCCAVVFYCKEKLLTAGLEDTLVCGCSKKLPGLGLLLCLFSRVMVVSSPESRTSQSSYEFLAWQWGQVWILSYEVGLEFNQKVVSHSHGICVSMAPMGVSCQVICCSFQGSQVQILGNEHLNLFYTPLSNMSVLCKEMFI